MKREKVSTFFKSKGFYVSLFTGIFAVFVLTMVYANVNSIKRQSEDDLSEYREVPGGVGKVDPTGESAIGVKPDEVAEQQDTPNKSETAKEEDISKENEVADGQDGAAGSEGSELASGPELESEYGQADGTLSDLADGTPSDLTDEAGTQDLAPTASVNDSQNILQNLHFDEELGLLWPAEGTIIKNYSMEKLVYFETLDQYKCNPAILIGLEPGSDVLCGAKGVVTAISESEELGNSILVDIGDGYQLRYAQLSAPTVQVGDLVEEGAVLAKVAEPTIYYSAEGCNLYFQVLQDGETVNPLLLLR